MTVEELRAQVETLMEQVDNAALAQTRALSMGRGVSPDVARWLAVEQRLLCIEALLVAVMAAQVPGDRDTNQMTLLVQYWERVLNSLTISADG